MISEMWIFGQERTVQVGTIRITVGSSFHPIFGVVPVPFQNTSQWFRRSQVGAPSVILETNQRGAVPANGNVSDTAWHFRAFMDGPCIEHSQPTHIRPFGWSIVMRERSE